MNTGDKIKMEFNGRAVEAPKGITVLRAAELNGIFIPTLCSHKDLSPFGGCRMCIVEIDGIRGYPLACNTLATDGMKVLTESGAIQDIRREVLRLILSEHPSSCLICDEKEECKKFQGTVRKSGVASGCRYCPNDGRCELQDLVEKLGITEVGYPVIYRGYEAERSDPFFDRDYNICILCGRCVRMCQEMRGTAVLAFNYRGPSVKVGPAYGRSHIEAGCEFCGACVSVCPTGALAEKASKWDGKPDSFVESVCPYCAIGCQLDLYVKNGKFSVALPVLDPEVNDGQACVKGRFCIGEVSHHFERARKPFAREGGYWKEKTWDEAIGIAVGKLKELSPGEFSMIVSPDLTNESLYAAQKFVRTVMGTNSIDSTARTSLGGGFGLWTKLFGKQISINEIKNASRILAVGLDTRFNFSIIGVEIRKAMQKGATLVTIGPRESNLARYAECWLRPAPGFEGTLLKALASGKKKDLSRAAGDAGIDIEDLEKAFNIVNTGENLVVIIGPSVFKYSDTSDLNDALSALIKRENASIIPLYVGANTRGAIETGVFPDILPGPAFRTDKLAVSAIEKLWDVKLPTDKGITLGEIINGIEKPKVIYLVGTHPTFKRLDCEFLIVQDIFEPDFECDLYLPASGFLESPGTLTNVEGRVQELNNAEKLPDGVMYGRARPDWMIFSLIAKAIGKKGFEYESDAGKKSEPKKKGKFLLTLRPMNYIHRGISITTKVEGLQIINPEFGFYMSSEDADEMGISEGETITVEAGKIKGSAPARIEPELPKGVIYLYVPDSFGGQANLEGLEGLFRLEENPHSAEVKRDAV